MNLNDLKNMTPEERDALLLDGDENLEGGKRKTPKKESNPEAEKPRESKPAGDTYRKPAAKPAPAPAAPVTSVVKNPPLTADQVRQEIADSKAKQNRPVNNFERRDDKVKTFNVQQGRPGGFTGTKPGAAPAPQPQREYSPFSTALWEAKKIKGRDNDLTALKAAMSKLDERGQRNLVFRLQGEVLEGKADIAALYAVARLARMIAVAHSTATVNKAMREGGLTLEDLQTAGVARTEVWVDKSGKQHSDIRYALGYSNLRTLLLPYLQKEKKTGAAAIIDGALRQQDARRLEGQAVKAYALQKAVAEEVGKALDNTPGPAEKKTAAPTAKTKEVLGDDPGGHA